MFQAALKKVQQYTLPVVVSSRRQDGTTGSSIGVFIVLNRDGWILTAWHIVDEITKIAEELTLYNKFMDESSRIKADETTTRAQKKKELRSLAQPPKNAISNFSPWWGRDGWRVNSFHLNPLADLALGQIEGFDESQISNYPEFKNPSSNFDVGENLCKLGFPFHGIIPLYDESKNAFQLPPEALPIPLFPIEGMFTRTIMLENGSSSAAFVETSSPGLRGQSGGPTFDEHGRIWAIQSRTIHHPLGFSPQVPNQRNREHQFLNAGMGTHAQTVTEFLNEANVQFCMSTD